jgi:hypothetical protein
MPGVPACSNTFICGAIYKLSLTLRRFTILPHLNPPTILFEHCLEGIQSLVAVILLTDTNFNNLLDWCVQGKSLGDVPQTIVAQVNVGKVKHTQGWVKLQISSNSGTSGIAQVFPRTRKQKRFQILCYCLQPLTMNFTLILKLMSESVTRQACVLKCYRSVWQSQQDHAPLFRHTWTGHPLASFFSRKPLFKNKHPDLCTSQLPRSSSSSSLSFTASTFPRKSSGSKTLGSPKLQVLLLMLTNLP